MKKISLLILLVWGNYNSIAAQARRSSKPKSSYIKKKSTSTSTASKKRKTSYQSFSKRLTPTESVSPTTKLSISKAKEFYRSNFILQAFRIFEQYQNSKEMDAEAFALLGECWRSIGTGVNTDYKKAEFNFIQSLSLNPTKEIHLSLGQIYQLGGFNLSRSTEKAITHFQKAVDMNNPIAKFELGRLYFQGLADSLRDENKGIALLEEAGNQNIPEAQWMLGSVYTKGFSNVKGDMQKAKFWFKKYKDNPTVKQNAKL